MGTFLLNTGDGSAHLIGAKDKAEVEQAKAALAPKLPPASPIGEKRMALGGPDRAWPVEEEQVLRDGSKSQRFSMAGGTSVLRRTCAPKQRGEVKTPVWWEIEVG